MKCPGKREGRVTDHFWACTLACPFCGRAAAIDLSLSAISVKLGLSAGSADQHLSIRALHSDSQDSSTGGRNVLLTIPPVEQNSLIDHITMILCCNIEYYRNEPIFYIRLSLISDYTKFWANVLAEAITRQTDCNGSASSQGMETNLTDKTFQAHARWKQLSKFN